jgi:hypothetical protein
MKSFLLPVLIFSGLLLNAVNLKAQSTYYQVSVYFKTGVTRIFSPGDTAVSVINGIKIINYYKII